MRVDDRLAVVGADLDRQRSRSLSIPIRPRTGYKVGRIGLHSIALKSLSRVERDFGRPGHLDGGEVTGCNIARPSVALPWSKGKPELSLSSVCKYNYGSVGVVSRSTGPKSDDTRDHGGTAHHGN